MYEIKLKPCLYKGKCIMRDDYTYTCTALRDTYFEDGECHFRKETEDGPNVYDQKRKENRK